MRRTRNLLARSLTLTSWLIAEKARRTVLLLYTRYIYIRKDKAEENYIAEGAGSTRSRYYGLCMRNFGVAGCDR